MITTTKKCDRCKCETEQLIDILMVNQNVKLNDDTKEPQSMLDMFYSSSTPKHPTITKEVCVDCAKQFCRWVEHSENLLTQGKPVCTE